MGIGDWGLGIGDWGLGPIPNPQSPIPNPQLNKIILTHIKIILYYNQSINHQFNYFNIILFV